MAIIVWKSSYYYACNILRERRRRHPSIPWVCTYKEFQKCMKCVRNVFVVWEAFSIWWNQARTVVSGNILASVQGRWVYVVAQWRWQRQFYQQTGQNFEMATICVKVTFFLNQLTQEKLKQSLGYECGCNRKLINNTGCLLSVHAMSDLGLSRSLFAIFRIVPPFRKTKSAIKVCFIACESLLQLNRSFTNDWGINNIYFNSSGSVIFWLDGVVKMQIAGGLFNSSLVVYFSFGSVMKAERSNKYPNICQEMTLAIIR